MTLNEIDSWIDRELCSLPGWCTFPKAKRLVRIAYGSGVEFAVELGVHGGRSLISMALGFKLAGYGMAEGIDSYVKVDTLEGEHQTSEIQLWNTTDFDHVLDRAQDGIKRAGVTEYARIIRKRGDDAVIGYPDGRIGLFHLDGNHSELVSQRDVTAWLPKMALKSTWIIDDTQWPTMQPALRIVEAGGFRVVEKGENDFWRVYVR